MNFISNQRTKKLFELSFQQGMKKGSKRRKKATEKKEEARSGDIRDMLPNPRSKNDNPENYCTQLSPCLIRFLSVSSKGGKIIKFWLLKIFSRVIIFAISTFRNIHAQTVFDFNIISTENQCRENQYLYVTLKISMHLEKK